LPQKPTALLGVAASSAGTAASSSDPDEAVGGAADFIDAVSAKETRAFRRTNSSSSFKIRASRSCDVWNILRRFPRAVRGADNDARRMGDRLRIRRGLALPGVTAGGE